MGALAVSFITATYWLHRRGERASAGRMGVAAIAPLALSLAAALPGDAAAPRVFLAAAFLVAWSLLLLAATSSWVAIHTTVFTVAATVAAHGRRAHSVAPAVPDAGLRSFGGVVTAGAQCPDDIGGVGALPPAQCARPRRTHPRCAVAG